MRNDASSLDSVWYASMTAPTNKFVAKLIFAWQRGDGEERGEQASADRNEGKVVGSLEVSLTIQEAHSCACWNIRLNTAKISFVNNSTSFKPPLLQLDRPSCCT